MSEEKIQIALNKRLGPIALVLVVVLVLISKSCLVYIKPNEFGIKQVNISVFGAKGIHKEIYTAGFNFVLPFGVEKIHVFPKNIQVLELADEQSSTSKYGSYRKIIMPSKYTTVENAANIQTSDGFQVTVDVSILYRIVDPYLVITNIGYGTAYIGNGIIPKAEPKLKEALGSLTTEEFYNSPLRVTQAEVARELLNQELKDKGIYVEHVLVRYFKYSSEIQKNIEYKKLKDQLVFKNRAEANAAKEKANWSKVIEEGKAAVSVKLEEGDAYRVKKMAEIDLYVRQNKAKADLLVKLAEAKKTELKNNALQGAGSSKMVGLKMAEALKGIEVIMLSSGGKDGLNPLDLDKTVELFGVKDN